MLIYLLIAEVAILSTLFVAILWHRVWTYLKGLQEKRRKARLSEHFLRLIETKEPFNLRTYPGKRRWYKSALQTLESFERRLQGDDWNRLKKEVVSILLIKKARSMARSWFWMRRNLAARIFALYGPPVDEPLVLRLMDDKRFLVKGPAAVAAIGMDSFQGVTKILEGIRSEPGFAHFFYRDALAKGSAKVFEHILKLGKEPALHKAVLEVLGAQSWGGLIPFLETDLKSSDPDIRALAIGVLLRTPLPNALTWLEMLAKDTAPSVRKMAFSGLKLFPSDTSWPLLEQGLSDPVWEVRLAAASTLKARGEQGAQILARQTQGIAAEVARYAVCFG
jgi:hypothetical protein